MSDRGFDRDKERDVEREEKQQRATEILDRLDSDKRDPDRKERSILSTRDISLKREERENNREIGKIASRVNMIAKEEKNPDNIREIISKMQVLDMKNEEIRAERHRIEKAMFPQRTKENDLQKELDRLEKKDDIFKARAEKNTVYREENGNISLFYDGRENMYDRKDIAVRAVEDLCRYKSISGEKIETETRSFIAGLELKEYGAKIEKEKLEVIVSGKHPDAIRDVYEFGLRVGTEKIRPQQMNNMCNILRETESKEMRVMELDRMLSGRIPSSVMGKEEIGRFIKNCERDLEKKKEFHDLMDKVSRVESLQSDRFESTTRGAIVLTDQSLDRMQDKYDAKQTVLDMFQVAKEYDLRVTVKTQEFLQKFTKEEMTREDLRTVMEKIPEYLPAVLNCGVRLPSGVTIEEDKYKEALKSCTEWVMECKEPKLAVYSVAFRDENGKPYALGEYSQKILDSKVYVAESGSLVAKAMTIYDTIIAQEMKEGRVDRREQQERMERLSIREALDRISADSPKESVRMATYALCECAKQDAYSKDILKEIKEKKVDFSSLSESEKLAPEKYVKAIVYSNHPEVLLDVNRLGIQLHKGGTINDERMQGVVSFLKNIEASEKTENVRMAALQAAFADKNGNLKNPLNMGSKERNEEVRSLAVQMIKDDVLKKSLDTARENERLEKEFTRKENEALERVVGAVLGRTGTDNRDLKPVEIQIPSYEKTYNAMKNSFDERFDKKETEHGLLLSEKELKPVDLKKEVLIENARLYVDNARNLKDIRELQKTEPEKFGDAKSLIGDLKEAAAGRAGKNTALPSIYNDMLYYDRLKEEGKLEYALEKAGNAGLTVFDTSLRTQSAMANILRDETVSKEEKQVLSEIYLLKTDVSFRQRIEQENLFERSVREAGEREIRNALKVYRGEMIEVKKDELKGSNKPLYVEQARELIERQDTLTDLMQAVREEAAKKGEINNEVNRLLDSMENLSENMYANIFPLENGNYYISSGVTSDLMQTDRMYKSVERYLSGNDRQAAAREMIAHEELLKGSKERCDRLPHVEKRAYDRLTEAHLVPSYSKYSFVGVACRDMEDYARTASILTEELVKNGIGYNINLIEQGRNYMEELKKEGYVISIELNNAFELCSLSDEAKMILREPDTTGVLSSTVQRTDCQNEGKVVFYDVRPLEESLRDQQNMSFHSKNEVLKEFIRNEERFPLEKEMRPVHRVGIELAKNMRESMGRLDTAHRAYVEDRLSRQKTGAFNADLAEAWKAGRYYIDTRSVNIVEEAYKRGDLNDREKEVLDSVILEQRDYFDSIYRDLPFRVSNVIEPSAFQEPDDRQIEMGELTDEIYREMYGDDYLEKMNEIPTEEEMDEWYEDFRENYGDSLSVPIAEYVQDEALIAREIEGIPSLENTIMYDAFLKDEQRMQQMPELREFYEKVSERTEAACREMSMQYGFNNITFGYDFKREMVIIFGKDFDGRDVPVAGYDGNYTHCYTRDDNGIGSEFFAVSSMCRNRGVETPDSKLYDEIGGLKESYFQIMTSEIDSKTADLFNSPLLELPREELMELLQSDITSLDAGIRNDVELLQEGLGEIKTLEMERDSMLNPDLMRYSEKELAPYDDSIYITQDEIEEWLFSYEDLK